MRKAYRTMRKNAKGKVREVSGGSIMMELPLPMAEVMMGMTGVVEELSREAGLLLISAVLNSECERIAGKKHSRNPGRRANWHGSEGGSVYFDGQKVNIERPRVRSTKGGEIPLSTYEALRSTSGMKESVLRKMVLGLTSRNYEEATECFLKGYGIKKSSVSRHFVKASSEQMRQFMERDLSGLKLCAIFMDGIEFKGHLLVVALGLDAEGRKHVLGLREGATENGAVCTGLLEDMARRGLDTQRDYLFVLDGGKALRSAVTRMFGTEALVQRCQTHKRRNVAKHLPPEHQEAIDVRIRAAYNMSSHEDAKRSLELVVKELQMLNPSAAARSLREGLDETLTVHRLGIAGLLRKTLSSTNPIESCFSVTRSITGRVKRWRKGDMVQRWAVAALLRAESRFNRVKGYREIPRLLITMQQKSIDKKEMAA